MPATVELLDPHLVDVSSFSGRHESVFQTVRFLNLKNSINLNGGNAIPVFASPKADGRYTLGYGVLRLQACRELGLPVLSVVEHVDQVTLFKRMLLESEGSESLSPFERGTAYVRALDAGLFPSQRRLADLAGVTLSDVSTCLKLVRLPAAVIEVFPRPTEIKTTWAKRLSDAQDRDPDGLIERAKLTRHQRLTTAATCAQLTTV
jgi:ParB family transcriptional regulator, chromosome partitioning protein